MTTNTGVPRTPGRTGDDGVAGPVTPGQVVILNGPPRSGKTSIANQIQTTLDGIWLNLGIDAMQAITPEHLAPGIGLRPGGERPDLEELVLRLYQGMYGAVAAQAWLGRNVVVDAAHHDDYARPMDTRAAGAPALAGLTVMYVGVHCPVEVAMERRRATWGGAGFTPSATDDDPVVRWHREVHRRHTYDVEVDTAALSPAECAAVIGARLGTPARSAFFDARPPSSS